jgi:hypothetical protein
MLRSRLTVCVTGAGAGVDSAWEQKKLEARKMLENAAESPPSTAHFVSRVCVNKLADGCLSKLIEIIQAFLYSTLN